MPNFWLHSRELGMGAGTTKASSCVPCSVYMMAIGSPPTSIHLGRGGNWNIPPIADSNFTRIWEAKIVKYYKERLSLCQKNPTKVHINDFIGQYTHCQCAENEIPAIFLEALTFENHSLILLLMRARTKTKVSKYVPMPFASL